MSKFYTEIAKYYDYIFPTGNAQLDLMKEVVGEPPKDILDVACGSGGYSIRLSDVGYNITGIDLNEQMIDSLRKKNKDIDARVLNMLDIHALNKKFDLIFCIGNSLVHLNDNEEIFEFLKSCKNNLKSKGHLVIQIVNYDRVLDNHVRSLPTINNEDVNLVFERYYDYLPNQHKIDFKTILKVDGKELENHEFLHPIKSDELSTLLKKAGFRNIQLYGNFNKGTYDPMESFPLVIVAE